MSPIVHTELGIESKRELLTKFLWSLKNEGELDRIINWRDEWIVEYDNLNQIYKISHKSSVFHETRIICKFKYDEYSSKFIIPKIKQAWAEYLI